MLQRQIMFKQMQELQRRQQMQELADNRNQIYNASQPSSGGQFPPTVNGTPVHDSSQMFMLNNIQMMQHGGFNVVRELPNGFVLPQNQHHSIGPSLGLSQPQFGLSLYGTPNPNTDKNLNQYSHFQGPSDISLQSSAFGNSFMNERGNYASDIQDGSFQSSQQFQEKNLFGQVPLQSFNSGNLSGSYSNQRNFSHDDSAWRGESRGKELKFDLSKPDTSLDPLEQNILYNTNESTVEHTSYMDEFPSMQNGSWSALMQSAVAETSSSDTGVQEEWSGLSFQNPEPSPENQQPNFISSERPQSNWTDMNLFNVSSSKPQPEQLFPGFLQPGQQQKYETFHASNQHSPRSMNQSSDHDSQQKHPIGRSQLIQTSLPSTSMWPDQHNEHVNINEYKPHSYFSGDNGQSGNMLQLFNRDVKSNDHTSGVQLNLQVSTPNELPLTETSSLSKSSNTNLSGGFSFPLGLADNQTPQPYSFFPSLSMGNSSAASLPSRNINDYIKNQGQAPSLPGQMAISSAYSPSAFLENSQSKTIHSSGQEFPLLENMSLSQPSASGNVGFSITSPNPWSSMKTQQNLPVQKSNEIPNFFRPPDFNSGAPNNPPNQNLFRNEGSFDQKGSAEMNNSTLMSSTTHNKQESLTRHSESDMHQMMPSRQAEQRRNESPVVLARDIGAFGRSSKQKYSLDNSSRNAQPESGIDYQNSGVKDKAKINIDVGKNTEWNLLQEAKASSTAYIQNLQTVNMFGQSDTNETSNLTNQSQVSLQMAPSWFKHYGNVKDGQMLPISNPKVTLNSTQPLSGISQADLLEKSLTMQVNLANAYQGSNVWPSTTVPPIVSKSVVGLSMLTSNVSQQSTVTSTPKRKMVVFEMLPWYKEVNHEPSKLQIIGVAGLQWAQALNRIPEVKNAAEIVEDAIARMVRAKRRLVFTTELMQQLFRPPPAAILRADATDCNYVAHFTARLALGDACSLTGHLPPDNDEMSPEKVNTSIKPSASDFSKIAEVFIGRVKKFEDDFSRVDKSLSIVDIKMENQDLEKFSLINRFTKFHLKTQQNAIVDPAASSSVPQTYLQRYVIPHPMPQNVPEEGIDCLSL